VSGRKLLDLDRATQRPRATLGLVSEPGVADLRDAKLIDLERIVSNPTNPRKTFKAGSIKELADSIARHGILNPLTVRRSGDGYELIAGERRMRAARLLGLREVPCIVREASDEVAYVEALIENLQRENIAPSEEARALEYLLRERNISQRELARLIHKDVSYVSRRVRVYNDPVMRDAVQAGQMPVSTAERLLAIKDPSRRRVVLRQTIEERLTQQDIRRRLMAEARAEREGAPAGAMAVGLPNRAERGPGRAGHESGDVSHVGNAGHGFLAGAAVAAGGDPVLVYGERLLSALQSARDLPDEAERLLLGMLQSAIAARLRRAVG
jgi:ParB family chromosome partitioning protein